MTTSKRSTDADFPQYCVESHWPLVHNFTLDPLNDSCFIFKGVIRLGKEPSPIILSGGVYQIGVISISQLILSLHSEEHQAGYKDSRYT